MSRSSANCLIRFDLANFLAPRFGRLAIVVASLTVAAAMLFQSASASAATLDLTGCTSYNYWEGCAGTWWTQGAGLPGGDVNGIYITNLYTGANIGVYVDDSSSCSGPPQPVPATSSPSPACVQEWITYWRQNPPPGLSGSFPIYGGYAQGWGYDPSTAVYTNGQALYEWYPYAAGYPDKGPPEQVTCGFQGYIIQRYYAGDPPDYPVPNSEDFMEMWEGALGAPAWGDGSCNTSAYLPIAWY